LGRFLFELARKDIKIEGEPYKPLILVSMDITGHVKESAFLKYIGKPKGKDDNALLFLRYLNIQGQNA